MIDTLIGRIEICIHVFVYLCRETLSHTSFFDRQSGSWGGKSVALLSVLFSFHVCRRGNDADSIEILIRLQQFMRRTEWVFRVPTHH